MKILRISLVIVLLVLSGRTLNTDAQTVTNLYIFGGNPGDGSGPSAGLVQESDGNFYGTTEAGGVNGSGTVFRISPSGSYSNLYSFGSYPSEGVSPSGVLVQGSDGSFYGTTLEGGGNWKFYIGSTVGTVFRISPGGSETVLHPFGSFPTDGAVPSGGLVQGSDANFYGTTAYGGSTNLYYDGYGYGTVFRISPGGNYTILYSFAGPPTDGATPRAGLMQGSDGNFYGTTSSGGNGPCTNIDATGCGTIFRISPGGETVLHYFGSSPTDGASPNAGLVQGSDGNLYGTTSYGGTSGYGTVFRISISGSYTSLYSFVGQAGGGNPAAVLVQGSDGNFYGTTPTGGLLEADPTVFRISSSGSFATLCPFGGDVANGLVQGSDGSFYGTTLDAGTNYDGTVFKVTIPLNPPANQISGIQLAGTNVLFNIPSVAGEAYQLQFSSSLTPTNWVNEGGTITSIGSILTLTNFAGANQPQGFYRFAITP
jgi:uncharacterized repeat protein (TIGR03803 family)